MRRYTWLLICCGCGLPSYRVATLPPEWRQVQRDGETLRWHHTDGGSIASARNCERADDVPLDVLTNHLLIGVEARRERSRAALTIDGRTALRTRLEATLDGVPVALDLVVLKKDGCTYDLALVAAPAIAPRRTADFEHFIAGFASGREPR